MKRMIISLLFIFPIVCIAQVNITARVINHADNKPVANASVFLSNATIGTKTDNDGTFTLNKVKTGKYDLVVSVVGFETYRQFIIVNNAGINLPDISIIPKTISLMEVKIRPQNNTERQRNIQQFIDEFIGTSALARECRLLNPEILDVDFDAETSTLTASSGDFLIIENRGLGYRLKYLLGAFYNNRNYFGSLKTHYEGSVLFENLKGTPADQKRWKKNREDVYENSSMHFFRSVIANQVEREGFRVFQYANEPNALRPPDDLITAKINQFTKLKAGGAKRYSDSLSYWVKKSKLDKTSPNLRNFFLNQQDILKPTDVPKMYALNCELDGLHITYNKDRHFSKSGALNHLNAFYNTETSLITFNTANALVDNNGWLIDPNSLWYSGAWSHYRVAELLPVDYERAEMVPIGQTQSPVTHSTASMVDSIAAKLALYKMNNPRERLYVYFDKTTYTNNEDIWFTGYLLNCLSTEKHNTLSVALISDDERKIALEQLFLIKDGLSYGHLTIPDTIAPGNYHLLAYSNVLSKNGKPVDVYDQAITIKTTRMYAFDASAKLLDTVRDTHGNLTAIVRVDNKNINVKPIADIEYALGKKVAKGKTNAFGEYAISIPPASGNLLKVSIKKGSDLQFLNLHLPVNKGLPSVKFYPEGGNMVENTDSFIGWEARSSTGEYLKLRGILCKNSLPIDTIETNYYGIGKFKLLPKKNCSYSFRIIRSGSFADVKDTTYNLPSALPAGPTVHIPDVLAEDTLIVQLKSTSKQKVTLLLHNFNDIIGHEEIEANPAGYQVKFILTDAPKGLTTLTVLDSLGRPLAERLFFAHYRQQNNIALEVDKTEYSTREKVNIKLKLNNIKGEQTNGVVSIACVQENRVENNKQTDITTYAYLKHDLRQLPSDPLGKNYDNPEYIRDLLLVKGWRRYTWTDVLKTNPKDTLEHDSSANFEGNIKLASKPLKKAVTVTVNNGQSVQSFDTKIDGRFRMPIANMITSEDKKIKLMVAGKIPELYTVDMINPYHNINHYLASGLEVEQRKGSTETNTRLQMITGFEKAITLKEVVVKGYNSDSFIDGIKWHQSGEKGICNDYVCENGILNCNYHKITSPGSYKPFINGHYIKAGSQFGIVYKGCILFIKDTDAEKYKLSLKGVNLPKEYYPIESAQIDASEPEYLSTIYWNYGIKVDSNNDVNLSFYTGDLTGNFRLIAQGAGENEVWSKQLTFTVKKKNTP